MAARLGVCICREDLVQLRVEGTETEESPLLRAVTRKRLVETVTD
jgi:hypothetical protein